MQFTLLLFLLTMLGACSFKSPDSDKNGPATHYEELKPQDLALMDTDGDKINDLEEKERGLNPFVANIPELIVRFFQNYFILVDWKKVNSDDDFQQFLIDTKVGRNAPDFKYRVGELLVRNKAFQEASRIGKFSSHSWGDIQESDLTRVNYPDIDKRFTESSSLLYSKYFNPDEYEVPSASIWLENTVKLEANSVYSSVKNLELNFYYYDYQKETYELLATKKIERHFNRDVNETFSVVLSDVPLSLIQDNYLKRGEFIISEVKDFEIPEINSKYSELMKSVQNKTIQMVVNTPLETRSLHVAPFKDKNRFSDLLDNAFPKQFKIEEDELTKVGQFENNLSDYTHLKEVKGEDKKGKWFIFTNRLSKSYLDHEFQNGETIVLSYLTGKELAEQTSEKFQSIRYNISGHDDFEIYPLGNISPNSVVDFQLLSGRRLGEEVIQNEDRPFSSGGSCGRNCTTWQYECHFKFNKFQTRNSDYEFNKDLSGEISQLSIIINEEEFNLKTLIDEKKVEIHWVDKSPHFRINDVSKIKEIFEANENIISLKIQTLTETTFDGVNLISYSGRQGYGCFQLAGNASYHQKIPVYEGSVDFNKWRHLFRWDILGIGKNRTYKQPFSLSLSSTVNNYHN